jgi:hypothetical protein
MQVLRHELLDAETAATNGRRNLAHARVDRDIAKLEAAAARADGDGRARDNALNADLLRRELEQVEAQRDGRDGAVSIRGH